MMATRDIAIACNGGGSHAAYTAGVLPALLGEFDNLGLAHSLGSAARSAAYREAGTEDGLEAPVLVAISALLGWYGSSPAAPRKPGAASTPSGTVIRQRVRWKPA
jgi:hypothetical protein